MTNKDKKLQVYYNSACPVCNAGIKRQKNRSTACEVQWHDIHQDDNIHRNVADDREFVRERLHAVDENGQVLVGIEAFALLWQHSPRERWKAKLIMLPGIKSAAILAYNAFAALLYRWNKMKKHW